ncbi:hypothetical protein LIER_28273 [Lithospermum erythrorhizon]|uniref:Uncharacterized protein n=1 Tax=Lithospermum erythrorhizon TaxID=34254 RepID=A0AAV3RG95_LITER
MSVNGKYKKLDVYWIVDTWPSNHMCCNATLFTCLSELPKVTTITFLDGASKDQQSRSIVRIVDQVNGLYVLSADSFNADTFMQFMRSFRRINKSVCSNVNIVLSQSVLDSTYDMQG